jgi:ribosome-binding protein aMBF1 (putative translation factor)
MTRHCHHCGAVYPLNGSPGRSEACEKCGADLHVCLNCAHYDAAVAHQCRERRAEPVLVKDSANFCEWFEIARRPPWRPDACGRTREAAARDALKKLFGD